MKTALLQIGTEHLPARFLFPTLKQLESNAIKILQDYNLKFVSVKTYGTYKKLVLEIKDLASASEDINKEVKGPPAKLLKDENGNFTKQAEGFASKNGIKAKDLVVVETEKGPFIYAKVKIKGTKTEKLLPEIFKQIIKSLYFPKNMVWEDTSFRFARPIRSIIALYGTKVIKFEIAGVISSNKAYGLSSFKQTPIKITSPESYVDTLKNQVRPILVNIEERRNALVKSVEACAKHLGYKADLDKDLIEESVSFTEHPVALVGDMSLSFMTLPKLLLTSVLKTQLKMFPIIDDNGNLQPHFIAIRDGISVNQTEVSNGFKNVMTARFTDAVFFYNNDLKLGLDSMKSKLNKVNFIDGMGNMEEKTNRTINLTKNLAKKLCFTDEEIKLAEESAKFAYADLTSSIVYEFPELQGYMGGVYASKENRPKEVAKALEEFYLPLTASSKLPESKIGALVSLVGKLDTLSANFKAGQVPSGSEDPFALRRQAMGLVRIILANKWQLTIKDLVELSSKDLPENANNRLVELNEFLWQRLQNILEEKQIAQDAIYAVKNYEVPFNVILERALILQDNLKSEHLLSVGEIAKRVVNILKKSPCQNTNFSVELLKEPSEIALNKALENLPKNIGNFEENLKNIATLKEPLEIFFKEVMVNDKDEKIRNNRLALLVKLEDVLTRQTADLSKLQKRG